MNDAYLLNFTDENGNEHIFELLGTVEYEGREYAVTLPEEGSEFDNGMVHIFEVAEELDSETDTYIGIDDDEIIKAVYDIFMNEYN